MERTEYKLKVISSVCMTVAALMILVCGVAHLIEWEENRKRGWYKEGFEDGVLYAIENSEIYTVDRYDPENPYASAWNGYDQKIFIEIDGHTYEHGMYQG